MPLSPGGLEKRGSQQAAEGEPVWGESKKSLGPKYRRTKQEGPWRQV